MPKSVKSYKVIRDYQCLYDTRELLRHIISYHVRDAYKKGETPGSTGHEGNSHAKQSR